MTTSENEPTENEQRAKFASRIPCVSDTDGDGNCPLPGCMHCHPENFTWDQLHRAMMDAKPHQLVLMLMPTVDAEGVRSVPGQMVIYGERADGKPVEAKLIDSNAYPFDDIEELRHRVDLAFRAYVDYCARRGVKLPEHE